MIKNKIRKIRSSKNVTKGLRALEDANANNNEVMFFANSDINTIYLGRLAIGIYTLRLNLLQDDKSSTTEISLSVTMVDSNTTKIFIILKTGDIPEIPSLHGISVDGENYDLFLKLEHTAIFNSRVYLKWSFSGLSSDRDGKPFFPNRHDDFTVDISNRINEGLTIVSDTEMRFLGHLIFHSNNVLDGNATNYLTLTNDYTAFNRDYLFINTTSNIVNITLPLNPLLGYKIFILDIGGAFRESNLILLRNGETIMSFAEDMILDINFAEYVLIYTGSDWRITLNK